MNQDDDDFVPPPTKMPAPEPAVPMPPPSSWANVIPGEPAFPVRKADGTWAAGGAVKKTLCIDLDGSPRCVHAHWDTNAAGQRFISCHGPPGDMLAESMTSCVNFQLK